jgi:hypothetical protein
VQLPLIQEKLRNTENGRKKQRKVKWREIERNTNGKKKREPRTKDKNKTTVRKEQS